VGSLSISETMAGVALFVLLAMVAGPLVRANIWLYRKFGWAGFAQAWERRMHWWLPTVRSVCVLFAVVFIAAALRDLAAR
jgi:hypothetical protein